MSVVQDFTESNSQDSATLGFLVAGPTDRNGVFAELLAELPTTYGALSINRFESVDLIEGHVDLWRARIRYGLFREKSEMESGDMEFRFTGATRQVTRTISRASRSYDSGGEESPPPPDLRIIGWKPESRSAQGASVGEPVHSFGWTVIVPFTLATASWRRSVGQLIGSVNSGTFFSYAAGEVLFERINDTVRADGEYRIEMSFSQSPNLTGVSIGGITVPLIRGWELLDVPETKFDEYKGHLVPVITRVKVHEVYPSASFSPLSSLLGV